MNSDEAKVLEKARNEAKKRIESLREEQRQKWKMGTWVRDEGWKMVAEEKKWEGTVECLEKLLAGEAET